MIRGGGTYFHPGGDAYHNNFVRFDSVMIRLIRFVNLFSERNLLFVIALPPDLCAEIIAQVESRKYLEKAQYKTGSN